eukprot:gene2128-2447_t
MTGCSSLADDDGLQLTAEAQKRRRKKGSQVALRISRSLCYQPPQLTEQDLKWDGTWEEGPAAEGVSLLDPVKAAQGMTNRGPNQRQQVVVQLEDVIAASPALRQLQQQQLPAVLIRCMAKLGFMDPTPIQAACWPAACAGKDLQGLAEPGSGKTLAYLLPAFARLSDSDNGAPGGAGPGSSVSQVSTTAAVPPVLPEVLILAPSHELAQQVLGQCTALFSTTGVSSSCVYGGVPKEQQVLQLQQRRPRVVVATPGRLLDLLDAAVLSLQAIVHVCAEHKKPAKLLKHLAAIKEASTGLRNPPRVLIFANKIKAAVFIHRTLVQEGYRAVMLHGKRSQGERQAAVADFKAGKAQVLVASDVASRGLDIRGLPYVVNYDFPSNLETYIH